MLNSKKGEMTIAIVFTVFITVIVGLAMYSAIVTNVDSATQTIALSNTSVTSGANGVAVVIPGQAVIGSVSAVNATGGEAIAAGNFTYANYQVVNGELTATMTSEDTKYAATPVKLTYTAEPLGYEPNSGSRAIILLIVVFTALAIAVIALAPTLNSEVMKMLGR